MAPSRCTHTLLGSAVGLTCHGLVLLDTARPFPISPESLGTNPAECTQEHMDRTRTLATAPRTQRRRLCHRPGPLRTQSLRLLPTAFPPRAAALALQHPPARLRSSIGRVLPRAQARPQLLMAGMGSALGSTACPLTRQARTKSPSLPRSPALSHSRLSTSPTDATPACRRAPIAKTRRRHPRLSRKLPPSRITALPAMCRPPLLRMLLPRPRL